MSVLAWLVRVDHSRTEVTACTDPKFTVHVSVPVPDAVLHTLSRFLPPTIPTFAVVPSTVFVASPTTVAAYGIAAVYAQAPASVQASAVPSRAAPVQSVSSTPVTFEALESPAIRQRRPLNHNQLEDCEGDLPRLGCGRRVSPHGGLPERQVAGDDLAISVNTSFTLLTDRVVGGPWLHPQLNVLNERRRRSGNTCGNAEVAVITSKLSKSTHHNESNSTADGGSGLTRRRICVYPGCRYQTRSGCTRSHPRR